MILIYMLVIAASIAGIAFGCSAVFGYMSRPKMDDAEISSMRTRDQIGQRALRQIANGDAVPILTATSALDDINRTYDSRTKAIR